MAKPAIVLDFTDVQIACRLYAQQMNPDLKDDACVDFLVLPDDQIEAVVH